jgi:hypothetical protein
MNENSLVSALEKGSLSALQKIAKSDLHSHAGRGIYCYLKER